MKPFLSKTCLFNISCSNAVFNAAKRYNGNYAWKTFLFRFKNCRDNHQLFYSTQFHEYYLKLADGSIIPQKEINPRLLIGQK
jgi:hypothetical protein